MVILLTGRGNCGTMITETSKHADRAKRSERMKRVLSTQTMRESDRKTIERGICARELMRRAGEAIYRAHAWQGPVAIVCGGGNNAGDGYVLASHLFENGTACTVFQLFDRCSEDGGYYLQRCREMGVPIERYAPSVNLSAYREIVDCIFGTGFSGKVDGIAADAINAINQSGSFVVSVDINSGLSGDSGLGACVRSDLTVSIGYLKYGHLLGDAKDVIKKLVNVDIGIDLFDNSAMLVEQEDLRGLIGKRPQNSHKGKYGYVSVLGGCSTYSGAIKLAGLSCAALRTGCGVAQLIVPASLEGSVSPYLLESTLGLLPHRDGRMIYDAEALDRCLSGQRALAIGMGWGRSEEYPRILTHLLNNYDFPVVIDADGLNTLAQMDLQILAKTACHVILTPHAAEMARLCKCNVDDVLRDPVGMAQRFAETHGVILLLKGPCTVVTDGENTYLVNRGCAGMATAGSGDVLSGVLVGLLGYAEPTAMTVALGAYLAGRAGELAEEKLNSVSMLASDTVSMLPKAISELM